MPDSISNGMALFFVWLFAIAAIHKLRAPQYYQGLISSYTSAAGGSRLLISAVALCELSVALLLLVPALQLAGFVGTVVLLLSYAAMMAWQYSRGRSDLQCGCAGPASTLTVGPALIARNMVCASLAIVAIAFTSPVSISLASAFLALVIAVFMIIVYLCSDEIIANAQAMAGDI